MQNYSNVKSVFLSFRKNNPELVFTLHKPILNSKGKYTTRITDTLHCDKATAEKILQKIKNDIELERFQIKKVFPEIFRKKQTLREFIDNIYLPHRNKLAAAGEKAPKTVKKDAEALNALANYLGDNFLIGDVEKMHIQDFLYKSKEKYSPFTINVWLGHLSGAFRYAVEADMRDGNPVKGVKRLKGQKKRGKPFTIEDLNKLRETPVPPGHRLILEFLAKTGARTEGILNANVNDMFSQVIDDVERHFLEIQEKGGKFRYLVLPSHLMPFLSPRLELLKSSDRVKEYLQEHSKQTDIARHLKRAEEGFIFFEITRPDSISQIFYRWMRKAGIKNSAHDTRHFFSTHYRERGGSMDTLQTLLGHKSRRTTEIYVHSTLREICRDYDKLTDF